MAYPEDFTPQKASEIPDEMLNPSDLDRIAMIHDEGDGSFKDYLIKPSTIRAYVLGTGSNTNTLKSTLLTFTEADYIEYEPVRWEKVQEIVFKPTTATTIKVGTSTDPEFYIAATSDKLIPFNILMDNATALNRQLNIALNGSGTVIITSILY